MSAITVNAWSEAITREQQRGSFLRLQEHGQRLLGCEVKTPYVEGLRACRWVGYGLKLAVVDFEHALVAPLIRTGCAFADRWTNLNPPALEDVDGAVGMGLLHAAGGRAHSWHAKAIGQAFLTDAAPALATVQRAHAEYLQRWNPGTLEAKMYFLPTLHGGAELCLATGQTEMAHRLLQVPPPFEECAQRQRVLMELIAAIRAHRSKDKPLLAGLFSRLGLSGPSQTVQDVVQLPQSDPAVRLFQRFFDLWRFPRGGDWIAHRDQLDAVSPEPDQTLVAVAQSLILDRFVLGHAKPDWRRVLGHLAA